MNPFTRLRETAPTCEDAGALAFEIETLVNSPEFKEAELMIRAKQFAGSEYFDSVCVVSGHDQPYIEEHWEHEHAILFVGREWTPKKDEAPNG